MDKQTFLAQLKAALSGLPKQEIKERLTFYSEMIDDRMEEGLSEEEAVAQIGDADTLVAQILDETPVKKKMKKEKKRNPVSTVLLWVGAPVWFPILLALLAVAVSLWLSLWAIVVCLWASDGAIILCGPLSIIAGIFLGCGGNWVAGAVLIAAGLCCSGIGILLFYPCKYATKGMVCLTKKMLTRHPKRKQKEDTSL